MERLSDTHRNRKGLLLAGVAGISLLMSTAVASAQGLPAGAQIVNGQVEFNQSGSSLNIGQSSPTAIISWDQFSIGQPNSVHFDNGVGATLNRVRGNIASQIDGSLTATGSVYLINPNGITVGSTGRIETGGSFIGSTLDISDDDFQKAARGEAYSLKGASNAIVKNAGAIGSLGGSVVLVAQTVENEGDIDAPNGTAALVAGTEVLVQDRALDGGRFIVKVGGSTTHARNAGNIRAAEVELRANGGNVYALAGNRKSIIAATGVESRGGRIFLTAGDEGTVTVAQRVVATKSASALNRGRSGGDIRISGKDVTIASALEAPGMLPPERPDGLMGDGGTVIVSGDKLTLAETARIDVSGERGGIALIGGDYQGGTNASANYVSESIKTAKLLTVAEGAVIVADGRGGDGGKIVLWSDEHMDFAGHVNATSVQGQGGDAEVSGKATLAFNGTANLMGQTGAGTLLLDPYNLTIVEGSGGSTTSSAAISTLGVSTLVGLLNTASVVLQTGGSIGDGTGNGDITVTTAISWSSATTLTMLAHRHIIIDAAITASSGSGKLILNADSTGTGTGTVFFAGGVKASAPGKIDIFYNPSSYTSPTNFSGNMQTPSQLTAYMLVNNVSQLQNIRNNLSATYALSRDINASGYNFTSIGGGGSTSNNFTGIFDGRGYIINGLTINQSSQDYVGLFGRTAGNALIRNVGLKSVNIQGQYYTGALVGEAYDSTQILNSYATGTVNAYRDSGGLVGRNYGTVLRSYTDVSVSVNNGGGGLVGRNDGTIGDTYALGSVYGQDDSGGLVGRSYGTIYNSYATGSVSGSGDLGGLIGYKSGGSVSNSYWDMGTTGRSSSSGGTGRSTNDSFSQSSYAGFNFSNTWYMADGATRPFLRMELETYSKGYDGSYYIRTLNQLQLIGSHAGVLSAGNTYYLANDINMTSAFTNQGMWRTTTTQSAANLYGFAPIGTSSNPFMGSFINNGYTITGLRINRPSESNVGLFGATSDATISGVILQNANVRGGDYTGALIGLQNGGIVKDVSISAGSINGASRVGGLVGRTDAYSIIQDSNTNITVNGALYVGGLIGISNGTVNRVFALGQVTSTGDGAGGLIGQIDGGSVSDSYASGAVTGKQLVGGLTGQMQILTSTPTLTNSYATGAVSGTNNVGGLVGTAYGSIINSYATGNVSGVDRVGGLVGNNYASINVAYASGTVSGDSRLGGLLGWSDAVAVSNVYATGKVTGSANYAGGLVGVSYANISNAYATGIVTGASFVGGLIGSTAGTTTSSFWNTNATAIGIGNGSSAGATGLTLAQLKDTRYFASQATGWDFETIWAPAGDGYAAELYALSRVIRVHADNNATAVYGDPTTSWAGGTPGLIQYGTSQHISGASPGTPSSFISSTGIDASGLNAGTYLAEVTGRPTAGANGYRFIYTANLVVTPAVLTVTPTAAQSKTYGSADSAFTYASVTGWKYSDTSALLSGSLGRVAGNNAGSYNFTAGTMSAGSNYTITVAPGVSYTITPATLTITPNTGQSKVYGSADPTLTYSASGWKYSDTAALLSGALGRVAGSNVGNYNFAAGTLSAGGNYIISVAAGRTFAITPAALTITANAQSKVYGSADPTLTYSTSGLVGGDTLSGSLTRVAGNNVGSYAINQGTLSAGSNYTVTYVGSNLSITPAALTITANAQSKVYGSADPTLTYSASGWKYSDTTALLTGALGRAAGNNVGTYAINQGTLSAGGNYTVTYVGSNLSITPATLTITPNAGQTKVYGDADPTLTYSASGWKYSDTSALLSGALGRVAGSNVGNYNFAAGTLSAGGNYTINVAAGSTFAITPASLTITANAQSKVYGTADPTLTYSASGWKYSDTTALLTGALGRAAGNNVGTYAINQGTLSAGSNYTITYVGSNLNITPAALTITPNAGQTKVYGDADPTLTYSASGWKYSDTSALLSGALGRVAGSNVGNYNFAAGTLSAGGNYTINVAAGSTFAITPASLTITANAQSKVYGSADPTLTYSASGWKYSDTTALLTGALGRVAGNNVGSYAINQGTLSAGSNYTVTYVGANLNITPATLTITPNAGQTKVYGDADPTLTYSASGWKYSDTAALLSGALGRVAGSNVGNYNFAAGTLSAGGNYTINVAAGSTFAITPAALTITANAQSKVYGSADPTLTYSASGWKYSDTTALLTGALGRVAGNNVGTYAINQGTLSAGSNYTVTYVGSNLSITPAALTITANARTKVYGDADPTLTYSTSGLVGGDTLSGSLTRVAGNNVGSYAINQGTLSAGSNYTVTYVGSNLNITPAALTITANAQSKIYGSADPTLTYSTSGLVGGDTLSGSLTRVAGNNVGTYAINQGTLSAGGNYTVTYVGSNLSITPAALTITANAQSKVYGSADPTLTYSASGWKYSDTAALLTGALGRAAGNNVGTYAINQGTLSAGGNYTVTYVGSNLSITPAALTITANARTKVYGDADPTLTYSTSGLVGGDTLSGSLTRVAGNNVGTYAINQGTLSAGGNYTVTYVGSNLSITPAALTITANAQSKVYGSADPTLTYSTSGWKYSDTTALLTGALGRAAGNNVGTYAINQGTLSAGGNYTVTYVGANLNITPATLTITPNAGQTKVYGDADPTLTYSASGWKYSDTAALLSGALGRVAGSNVGNYNFAAGTLSAGGNYTINVAAGSTFAITPASLTITANAQSKVYGAADPTLTYSASGLVGGDTLSGSLTRIAGSNVGMYAINQGTLSAGGNYNINYVGADLDITQAALQVVADAQSRVYGAADPTLGYSYTGLVNGDTASVFTGGLDRAAGSNVGMYAINQGTLSAGGNYKISYVGADLEITQATLQVVADAQSKVYGSADPTLGYSYTGLVNGDTASVFTGGLDRVAGNNVGMYAINQGTLSAGGNYKINYVGADLEITQATLQVVADAQSKIYGSADPALSYNYTGLVNGDTASVFTGGLDRIAGSNVGMYAINQGTLSAGGNYNISYVGADLEITQATLQVVADGQSKIYGSADPALSYNYTGLVNGDTASVFTGGLDRAGGNNVGIYAIKQGALSAGGNYKIDYIGAELEITPAVLTVNNHGTVVTSREYDGTDHAQKLTDGSVSGILSYDLDNVGLLLTDTLYNNANVALANKIDGRYVLTGSAAGNYILDSYDFQTFGEITQAWLTINPAEGQVKVRGQEGYKIAYTTSGWKGNDNASLLTGALSFNGEDQPGRYAITLGNLSAGGNYALRLAAGGILEIVPREDDLSEIARRAQELEKKDPNLTRNTEKVVYTPFDPDLSMQQNNIGDGQGGAVIVVSKSINFKCTPVGGTFGAGSEVNSRLGIADCNPAAGGTTTSTGSARR